MSVIAVDLDGVCVDSIPFIVDKLNKHFGMKYSISDIVHYRLDLLYGSRAYEAYELYEEEIYRESKPIPKSASILQKLTDMGYLVFYLTLRKNCFRDLTREWLRRYNYPNSDIIVTTSDKKAWLIGKKVDYVIEDNPHVAEGIKEMTTVILFDYPYNKNVTDKNIIRVSNWDEVWRYLGNGNNQRRI